MDQAQAAFQALTGGELVVDKGRGPAKLRYSHADMVDFIIANPWAKQKDIAARYGYTEGWVSTVMASDAFQAQLALRRGEVVNPVLVASVEEQIRGVTALSLRRLQEELEKPMVKPEVVLRAAEFGAKAMGIGGNAPPQVVSPNLDQLAQRLVALQSNVRKGITYEQGIEGQLPEQLIEGERISGGAEPPGTEEVRRQELGSDESAP